MISDMIFGIEHLFWLNTSWSSREESNHYHGQDLLAEKTLSVTLNDINIHTRVKFELAAPNLMKSNRRIAEEQDKDKLGKLCSERKACRQKWLTTLCLSGRRMCITWYLCSSNWDRVIPKWFCHHNTASSCMHAVNT